MNPNWFRLILFLELSITVPVNFAAFYKDLKFFCLECNCDGQDLLALERSNDSRIDNLRVVCEETPHGKLLGARDGIEKRRQILAEADFKVSPDAEIHSVDLFMNSLNLTSVNFLNHLKKTEKVVQYRKVSLADNLIESLPDDFSTGLETVKILDLSKNQLTRLDRVTLAELAFLLGLNLSQNKLNSQDLNVLEHSPLLEEVDLSWNRIDKLFCENLELKRLKKLDLSSNFLFGSTICSSPTELSRNSSRDLTVLEQPFSFPELTYLNLSRNQFDSVTERTFVGMPRLRVLDLSQNRLVSFQFDPPRALDGLESLFLNHNRIRSVVGTFLSLRRLDLAQNEIEKLDKVIAQNLAWLSIRHNNLTNLETVLKTSPKIEVLDASWNNMQTVTHSRPYGALRTLSLDGNPLVSTGFNLSGLISLSTLNMSFIPTFETFDTSSLQSVFDGDRTSNCTILNMAYNQKLQEIIGSLSEKNICQIDLSYNQLTAVEKSTFNWDKIESINLQGNPFHCECSLKWMIDFLVPFLIRRASHLLTGLSCKTPDLYKGKRLVHWFRRKDFCNIRLPPKPSPPMLSSSVIDVSVGTTNEPETVIQSASIIMGNKGTIAVFLMVAIILVLVAIGYVLLKKQSSKRRKEYMRRNRRYPNNIYRL